MSEFREVYSFLLKVDVLFPIPLSEKQNLDEYARKLCDKAVLCAVRDDHDIVALLAGYINDSENNIGYISMVATLPMVQGKGYGSSLVREFLNIACRKGLRAVHLYAVRDNLPAMRMYRKIGFVDYVMQDEPRPGDAHLIYYFGREEHM